MKSLSWLLSTLIFGAACIAPAARAEITIGGNDQGGAVAAPADTGTAVQAVTDAGATVVEYKRPAQEENKWLPWLIGAGAAAAALVAGLLIADAGSSDSDAAEASAAAAAGGAAAAAQEAAAAEAALAAQEAAAQAATIAEAQAAADAIAEANGTPKTKVFISGAWQGTPVTVTCGMGTSTFTPMIVFSVANLQAAPGGVANYNKSGACADNALEAPAQGGNWSAITGTNDININVDDPFYTGRAKVFAPDRVILGNGAVLKPAGGFAILQDEQP